RGESTRSGRRTSPASASSLGSSSRTRGRQRELAGELCRVIRPIGLEPWVDERVDRPLNLGVQTLADLLDIVHEQLAESCRADPFDESVRPFHPLALFTV